MPGGEGSSKTRFKRGDRVIILWGRLGIVPLASWIVPSFSTRSTNPKRMRLGTTSFATSGRGFLPQERDLGWIGRF